MKTHQTKMGIKVPSPEKVNNHVTDWIYEEPYRNITADHRAGWTRWV